MNVVEPNAEPIADREKEKERMQLVTTFRTEATQLCEMQQEKYNKIKSDLLYELLAFGQW